MAIYLVDYENVYVEGIKGVCGLKKTDKVHIFYTQNRCGLTFALYKQLISCSAEISIYEVKSRLNRNKNDLIKNALDIQLMLYLGYVIGTCKNEPIYIVSKDTDFLLGLDFIQRYLRDGTQKIELIPTIETVINRTKEAPPELVNAPTSFRGAVCCDTITRNMVESQIVVAPKEIPQESQRCYVTAMTVEVLPAPVIQNIISSSKEEEFATDCSCEEDPIAKENTTVTGENSAKLATVTASNDSMVEGHTDPSEFSTEANSQTPMKEIPITELVTSKAKSGSSQDPAFRSTPASISEPATNVQQQNIEKILADPRYGRTLLDELLHAYHASLVPSDPIFSTMPIQEIVPETTVNPEEGFQSKYHIKFVNEVQTLLEVDDSLVVETVCDMIKASKDLSHLNGALGKHFRDSAKTSLVYRKLKPQFQSLRTLSSMKRQG